MLKEKSLEIPIGPNESLEGRGVVSSSGSEVALVMTHPYATLGGNMDNNVVVRLMRHFAPQGYNLVRFNFRGVGASAGSGSWTAVSETDDVRHTCRFLLSGGLGTKISKIVLVGYSFGSVCASAVANDFPEVLGYVSIAYPFTYLWALTFFNSSSYLAKAKTTKPKLFLVGTKDNFTSLQKFEKYVEDFPEPRELEIVEGADHFFFNRERDLSSLVEKWLASALSISNATQRVPATL